MTLPSDATQKTTIDAATPPPASPPQRDSKGGSSEFAQWMSQPGPTKDAPTPAPHRVTLVVESPRPKAEGPREPEPSQPDRLVATESGEQPETLAWASPIAPIAPIGPSVDAVPPAALSAEANAAQIERAIATVNAQAALAATRAAGAAPQAVSVAVTLSAAGAPPLVAYVTADQPQSVRVALRGRGAHTLEPDDVAKLMKALTARHLDVDFE